LAAFNAIFQNSVYGVAARLPQKYTGAVVLGSNICGTLVVFMSWTSELFDSRRTSAIYYFITGIFVLLICFDTYFALPLNVSVLISFSNYYLPSIESSSMVERSSIVRRGQSLDG
jgi:hypothetical protein